ncbi:Cmx/CmrA family chloramphenicol efflux MFS transporter [Kibdelosporangium philippinense]
MPFAIYVLGLAVFAQGTSEFMLSGLVPDVADDLHISIPAAGWLTSAYAVGMVLGAPLVAMLSIRWPRRRALLIFLLTFLLAHVLGAMTSSFEVLLGTRIVAALANAGFLAVGLAAASAMVGSQAKGRATSVLLSGVTLACIAGVPLGAVLSEFWGWRSAFWAVAIVSVPAVIAILCAVPASAVDPNAPTARHELRALRTPRLAVTLLLGALVNGATFCTFTYLAPLVTDVAALSTNWVPVALALFGIGSFVGVTIGGRFADTKPLQLLTIGAIALLGGWLLFALTAANPITALALVFVQGTLSFAVGSTLIAQALYAATDAPTLAGGFATAAFNVGAAVGPVLGGIAIDAGLGYRSPLLVSAALVALALVSYSVARNAAHRSNHSRGRSPESF